MTFDPTSARPLEDQPEPAQRFNPAEAQPAGDALLRAQIRRAMGTDPLKASQAEAIARARDLDPEFVLRNYDQVLRETGVEDMARALEVDPMVGDYFRYSPLFAAKAQKDAGALIDVHGTIREFKGPEPTFENIARGLAASLPQGLDIVRTGLQGQMRDFLQWAGLVQPDPVADADFQRKLAQAQGAADFTRPEIQSRTGRAIYGGLESTLRTLPGVAASVVTRNPTPALATMGLQTQADAYGKYRTRGGAPLESFLGATGEGAVEVATELLPTKFLTEALGKRGVGEFLTGLLVRELPSEQVATLLQDAIDTAVANPNKTWEEYRAERFGAAYDTLVSTLTQTLVTGGAAKVLSSIAGTADEMGKAEVSARQLQAAFAAAAMVEMRQHAPQDFAQAIQSIAEQEGANDAIYMDAEVLAQSGIDIAQALPSAVDQMADALELNATVRLPIGEVLAAVAGTPQEQLFLQNARASETAWSLAEAEQIAETSKEFLANEQERVLQQAQDQSAWQSEVDTVQQTIKGQLDQAGRFTSDVNEGYARLQSQFFSVMASRFGITPSEMYQRFSVKVAGQMGQGEVLNARPMSTRTLLRKFGKQPANTEEAGAALSAGDRVFVFHDLEEGEPIEAKSISVIERYQPDQILVVSRFAGQDTVNQQGRDVTQTTEFKNWFGDSKVVDTEGRPLVVYHGSATNFDEFDPARLGTNTGYGDALVGFHFAESEADADFYANIAKNAEGDPVAGVVRKFYLSLENPLVVGIDESDGNAGERTQEFLDDKVAAKQYAVANGHDGIIYLYGTNVDSGYTAIAFSPTQIKSATGNSGAFDPNDPNILRQSVSTRLPTAKKATENPLESMLVIGLDAAKADPKAFEKNVELIRQYPNFRDNKSANTPDKAAEQFIRHVVDNLLWLHDQIDPAIRARAQLWYDGANAIATRWAEKYGLTDFQISGVLAVLSPQKDWFQNVSLGERVLDIMSTKQDFVWSDEMSATAANIPALNPEDVGEITGKTLGELQSDYLQAMWVRVYDQTYNERGYRIVTPEGEFGDWVVNADGKTRSKTAWGSFNEIGKAVSIFKNGDIANISASLGEQHKVRNFYNNIFSPNSEHGDVTIDTHAVAAALLRPLSGGSTEVLHNFGSGGAASSSVFGSKGTYGIYAEAYRRAAAERGILPRQMQSITWETVRSLFTAGFKSQEANVARIDAIWDQYRKRRISLDEARNQLFDAAGGIATFEWERPSDSAPASPWASSYTDELDPVRGADGAPRRGDRGVSPEPAAGSGVLEQQARGTFNPQTLLISLGPQSDLSTFLHESGHFFLEVMADLAAQPDAPAQVREDMDKVLGWFGVPDLATWQGYTLDQKRPHHERWAESFEQYLLEGKAPSAELQPLFRRFRAWLVNVYKSLTDFMRGRNLELNDEIRQVFDRMLATDEQIAQAEEQSGLLPDFDATNAAIERLQERSLRNLKWTLNARSKFLKQFTKEAKELRKGVLAEVMAEFEQRPDVMASRAIRKVRNKDGAERDAKIAAIADATGYPTVEEMTAAVTALGPVNEAVEAEVDRRMLERHGDMATQGALEAAANEAVHNEARARALAAELKSQDEALNPRETTGRTDARGRPITVNALVEAARAFGADLAARRAVGKLKNAIYLHRAAEARAGKAWQTATKKGDSKAAVQAKKDQLLNNQAVRALLDAQAEVRSAIEFFRKVTKGNNEKLVKGGRDPDVVNAMRAILGAYGIAPRTGKGALEYMEIVQTNDPETAKALMPAVINAVSRNKPYTELTVEELRGLTDDLKSMWRLAKESRQIEVDGVRMSIEDAREKLYGRLEEKGIPDKVPGQTSARTAEDKAAENLRELRGNLTRVEQWSEAMDGSIGGPFNTILFRAIKVAADNYRAARAPAFKRLEEATQAVKPFIARTPINAPRLNYVFGLGDGHNNTGMAELLAALLNTGNESNKRKLLLGGRPGNPWATENPDGTLNTSNWDATIADLVADGTLRKEHFDYVQAVWDVLESLKPLAQESHRRVFGRYFSEVTAQPFVDPFGVARSGGYYPAKVDPALVPDGQLRELARQENESLEFSFPAAPSGWSKSRVENYTKPLLLDTNLVYRHIDEVLLFSHMQPSVNAVNRLLRDRKLVSALSRVSPEAYGSILTPWLAGAARQIVEEQVPSDGGFNRAASIIRSRTGLQLMMANASNTLQQITGAFTAASKLEADGMERSALIKAAAKWASNPKALRDNVWSLSSYMRDRSENETAVLLDTMRDIMFNPTLMESAQKWSRQHGYFTQVFFDNTLSPIVWSAGYSAYLNKLPKVDTSGMSATEVQALLARQNREAVLYADALVRQTQGSNLPEDVSRFERGTGFVRLFNQFAGYFNMQANTNAASIVKLAEQGGLKKNAARGFYVLMMGLLMPIWVAEAIAIAFRGGPDDDDDDGAVWDDWLKAIFGLGTFKGLVAMVPVAGQIASAAVNRVATGSPADDRVSVSPVLSVLESAVGGNVYTGYQLATGKEVNAQRAVKDMALLIGLATGVPAYAVARPLGYAAGVAQGKIEPTGPADFARGMVTGTASPESKTP